MSEKPKSFKELLEQAKTFSEIRNEIDRLYQQIIELDASDFDTSLFSSLKGELNRKLGEELVCVESVKQELSQLNQIISDFPCCQTCDLFTKKDCLPCPFHQVRVWLEGLREVLGLTEKPKDKSCWACKEDIRPLTEKNLFVDIKKMPSYNPIVKDNVESVSRGDVVILNGKPSCRVHGAMNKVSKDGIWRCLMCGVGCYENISEKASPRTVEEASPRRVQRKRTRGFNLQAISLNGLPVVYVGRPTKWGNPFRLGPHATIKDCITDYRAWLRDMLRLYPDFLDPLKGKDLACWCPLDKPCHADVLLKLLKESEQNE